MKREKFRLLSTRQYRLFTLGLLSAFFIVGNSLYLVLAGHAAKVGENPEVLPVTYQVMLIGHIIVGVALVALAATFAPLHFRRMYKMKSRRSKWTGYGLVSLLLALLLSGLFILTEANSRENAWIFVGHQIAAALVLAIYLTHRLLSRDPPGAYHYKTGAGVVAALVVFIGSAHYLEENGVNAGAGSAAQTLSGSVKKAANISYAPASSILQHTIDLYTPFSAVGDPDVNSPFFPSKTTTSTGDFLPARILTRDDLPDLQAFRAETEEKGFAPSYYLGAQTCERCHRDIVEQWATSAHRFSSFNNPFYRKSVELTREKVSKKTSQFCGGCHDPAVMLAGNMTRHIDPLTPESQAGLTCLSCHAIDTIHDLTGNANYNIHDKTESPYLFDKEKGPVARTIHDYVLKAKPTVHKQRMLKPVFRQSEFCMTCHKVNLDVTVNDYHWLRGQNEYDAWHNSGMAHNQPMTWYEPPTVRQCQDCHMPLEEAVHNDVAAKGGKVRSHRFLSVNTALPYLRGDTDTIKRMEEFLQDEKLRVDIFAVRREDGSVHMGAENGSLVLKPGESIQVDVVVRNLNVGHTFPGGTNDSNQGWIDFQAQVNGREVYRSGALDENRYVDPEAHFYQAVLVDKNGNRIGMRNATDIFTTVYANVIAPSNSDIARYRFRVPENIEGGELRINAKLMWRKFNRAYTEFVFEGQPVPDLPITTIEADTLTLTVSDSRQPVAKSAAGDPRQWIRFNDYGIGSFADEDTSTSLMAFTQVTRIQPEKMDGWLNLGRTYLKEGNLAKADEMLRKASELAPDQPRLAFFWGRLLEKSGRLEEAASAYQRVLQTYPNSRDTWSRLGRTWWLAGRIEQSIEAFVEVLRLDPEHAQAFHQLSLAYKALATDAVDEDEKRQYTEAALEFEKGFQKYKLDERATKVTHQYRTLNPDDNRMSQNMIIHGDYEP